MNMIGTLLLLLSLCLLYPYVEEFSEWFRAVRARAKQRRLRRKAVETNRMLYKATRCDYYRQRAEELEKGGVN